MNSKKPQNPSQDFSENFDSDEMEIDVTYEEISPEEQQVIRKRVSETASANEGNSEPVTDMWLDDIIDILDVEEEVESNEPKVEPKNLKRENISDREIKIDNSQEDSEPKVIKKESTIEEPKTKSNQFKIEETEFTIDKPEIESKSTETATNDNTVEREKELSSTEIVELSDDKSIVEITNNSDRNNDLISNRQLNETETNSTTIEPTIEEPEINLFSSEAVPSNTEEPELEEPNFTETIDLRDDKSIAETTENPNRNNELIADSWLDEIETNSTATESTIDEPKINSISEKVAENRIEEQEAKEASSTETVELSGNKSIVETNKNTNLNERLIADSWLDESEDIASSAKKQNERHQELTAEITELERQKTTLQTEINNLKVQKETVIAQQTQEIADSLGYMIEEGTRELKERKKNLLVDIEKLERRKERIDGEMRRNFAGASQDLAVRIQGFKEYLVGSLQDLTTAAERLELPKPEERIRRPIQETPRQTRDRDSRRPRNPAAEASSPPQFTEQAFTDQNRRIRQLLDKYRTQPDYYGSPWQLRRTFEPIHAERVQEWFFDRGGRGAIKGMGSRLQNVLIASATISILHRLYSDRLRVLVLVDTPEKLGEWRRGLQDCLGVSRNDFGSNRGIVLFESADVLVQRADRLLEDKLLPLIIIDETEEQINLALLKFPLWLAFAEKPSSRSSGYLY